MAEVTKEIKGARGKGRLRRIIVTVVILGILGAAGFYLWGYLNSYESTDDAQIDGHINAISARINGQVIAVLAEDQQRVKAGDVLVRIGQTQRNLDLNDLRLGRRVPERL